MQQALRKLKAHFESRSYSDGLLRSPMCPLDSSGMLQSDKVAKYLDHAVTSVGTDQDLKSLIPDIFGLFLCCAEGLDATPVDLAWALCRSSYHEWPTPDRAALAEASHAAMLLFLGSDCSTETGDALEYYLYVVSTDQVAELSRAWSRLEADSAGDRFIEILETFTSGLRKGRPEDLFRYSGCERPETYDIFVDFIYNTLRQRQQIPSSSAEKYSRFRELWLRQNG